MADASFVQTSFHGGTWSAFAQGRMDLPAYKTAMATCLNALPIEEGACVRRSGFRHASATRGGQPGRVLQFAFEASAPYTFEMTDRHIRFFNGASLVTDAGSYLVTNITPDTPASVSISPAAPWKNGDYIAFTFVDGTSAAAAGVLAHRQFRIVPQDNAVDLFFLYDGVTGAPVDGSALGWGVGINLKVSRVLDLLSPYTIAAIPSVRAVQSEQQVLLLQGGIAPNVLRAKSLPSAGVNAVFDINPAVFVDGPYLDPPIDGTTLTSSGTTGTVTVTASATTSINGGQGFLATDVGRQIRMFSQPALWSAVGSYTAGDTVLYPDLNGVVYTFIGSGASGIAPPAAPSLWQALPQGQLWGRGHIVAVNSPSSILFQFDNLGLLNTSPIHTWRLGVYSDTTGYPTCGCYHEGRIWLGGAVKNRFDACMVGGIGPDGTTLTFSPTDPYGAVSDASGISYTLQSSDLNQILWMMPDLQGIVSGTAGGEWLIQSGTANTAITPTNIQAHRITKYGCANIEPRRTGLTTVFVQKYGRRLLEYLADSFSGKFYGPNLSEFGKAVTYPSIAEIAYQEELAPVVWARLSNGALAGITYRRVSMFSSQPPEFMAWHTHALGSNRVIESICVGPSISGLLDALTIITNDPTTGVRHVEVATDLFDEENVLTDAWFLDDAVVPSAATTVTINSQLYLRFAGLYHLANKKVSAWIAGLDCGDYSVSASGTIDVPYGAANGLLSQPFLAGVTTSGVNFGSMAVSVDSGMLTIPAVVGFTYTTRGQLLRPFEQKDTGARNGPGFAKMKRVHKFAALLRNTLGVSFGTTFDKLHTANFKTKGGNLVPPTQMFSGIYRDVCDDTESYDAQLCWQVTRPYPCTVVALGGFIQTQDV
jgi:hypothetical protein